MASIDDVVNLLANRALEAESEYHLNELMEIFPNLQYGMDVNPKFTSGPTGVEYTSNLLAFDLINVELVHGWQVDPQDKGTSELIGNKTYNALIELVIQGKEASAEVELLSKRIEQYEQTIVQFGVNSRGENSKDKTIEVENTDENSLLELGWSLVEDSSKKVSDPCCPEHLGGAVVNDDQTKSESVTREQDNGQKKRIYNKTTSNNDAKTKKEEPRGNNLTVVEAEGKETVQASASPADIETDTHEPKENLEKLRKEHHRQSVRATEGSLVNSFLISSSHQLTHHGLHELYAYLEEGRLCVFFRNNHFSTLTKKGGVLYLLVTDVGYSNVPEVVWEKLDGIDGNTDYVDSLFMKPKPQDTLLQASEPSQVPERDFQLAIQLSKQAGNGTTPGDFDDEEGRAMAAATEASILEYNSTPEFSTSERNLDKVSEADKASSHSAPSPKNKPAIQESTDLAVALQLQAKLDSEERSESLARQLHEEETRRATNQSSPARSRSGRSTSNSGDDNLLCIIS